MYNKTNLHSGMMTRVARKNDKIFEEQTKEYNKNSFDFPKPEASIFAPKRILTRPEKTKRKY